MGRIARGQGGQLFPSSGPIQQVPYRFSDTFSTFYDIENGNSVFSGWGGTRMYLCLLVLKQTNLASSSSYRAHKTKLCSVLTYLEVDSRRSPSLLLLLLLLPSSSSSWDWLLPARLDPSTKEWGWKCFKKWRHWLTCQPISRAGVTASHAIPRYWPDIRLTMAAAAGFPPILLATRGQPAYGVQQFGHLASLTMASFWAGNTISPANKKAGMMKRHCDDILQLVK